MSIVSFRIPRELKKKMDELKTHVNWSEEVRRFIKEKVREIERLRAIEKAEELICSLPRATHGTAAEYVRDDRDSN